VAVGARLQPVPPAAGDRLDDDGEQLTRPALGVLEGELAAMNLDPQVEFADPGVESLVGIVLPLDGRP
jgi:hypothetical protein